METKRQILPMPNHQADAIIDTTLVKLTNPNDSRCQRHMAFRP